ncbi:hypothetical protein BH11MYX3_BH11MYX3_06150 [soil metagenome]
MKRWVLVLLVAGCQTADKPAAASPQFTADDCPRFLAKARGTIQAMGAKAGMTYNEQMEASAVKDCRADLAAGRPMALGRCVLAATSEDAVHQCFPTYEQLMNGKAP